MTNSTPILASLLLIGAVATGGYWLYGAFKAGEVAPPPIQAPRGTDPAPPTAADRSIDPATGTTPAVTESESERVAVGTDATNSGAAQGVKGRILLPDGSPAAGVPIYLLENMMNDPIGAYLQSRSGRTSAPVASGMTATDGTFALGARQPDKTYDLRVASDYHPERTHQSITVRREDWVDTGDLTLEPGLLLTGRVIDEATEAGVAEALVFLTDSGQAHVILPTPGRERGLVAVTDRTGAFRFANAPRGGFVSLTAEAPGYASTTLINQPLRPGTTQSFTLEIATGRPIAGIVVDATGEPLPNVQVTAQGLSQKTPQSATATTGGNGAFEFPSLRPGPYQLATDNRAFAATTSPPVMAGATDVKLVLVQRPWIKLRVRTAAGAAIKSYRISLKRHFPNNPLGIGNVPEFADRSITPADYAELGDWAVVRGLPTGEFVFQIRENGHAKSLSPPFTVRQDRNAPEIEAVLTLGGAITGTVIDDSGKAISGALVSTDMNHALSGSGGFEKFIRAMMPARHSKAQARTDGQGRFRMNRLAFADYMLRVAHPDFCGAEAMDIVLGTAGQVVDIGVIRLTRGTLVEGYTTIGGLAAGQLKVSIMTPPPTAGGPATQSRQAEPKMFSATAISDNDGHYRLLQRVPPGTYKVQAMRASGSGNPFDALLDIRETEKTITIVSGQERMKLDFNLSAR